MGETTKISWTDHTFNPWIGCTKVSPGCTNCYADREDRVWKWTQAGWGKGKPRKRTSESNWAQPLAWDRKAKSTNVRKKVFCASLADILDDEVDDSWREDLWVLIEKTPNLDWLLLTKHIENSHMFPARWNQGFPENIWMGTSVENQKYADERIPILATYPVKVHFLSIEPLIDYIHLFRYFYERIEDGEDGRHRFIRRNEIQWVIVGGESGDKARPINESWIQGIVEECREAEVPVFVKQMGTDWGKLSPSRGWHGENMRAWPEDLRVREFPKGKVLSGAKGV